MRRLLNSLLPACFSILCLVATIVVIKPMCAGILWFQPEVPAALKR